MQTHKKTQATLYSIVFGSPYVKAGVFVMLTFLITQLLAPAFAVAAEEAQTQANVTETPQAMATSVTPTTPTPSAEPVVEPATSNTGPTTTESDPTAGPVQTATPGTSSETISSTDTVTTGQSTSITPKASTTPKVASPATTTTQTANTPSSTSTSNTAATSTSAEQTTSPTTASSTPSAPATQTDASTSTTEIVEETSDVVEDESEVTTPLTNEPQNPVHDPAAEATEAEEKATSTKEVVQPAFETQVNDLNRYQFGEQECVSVGDGAFYCTKIEEKPAVTAAEDMVYSEPDGGGDAEIFMRKNGAVQKITDNSYDDLSPYYDAYSDSIVWHQMRQGRYEIMAYSVAEKETTQLTQNTVNDMEPVRFGQYTAFQRWVGDNWEIVLHDGKKEKQLSHSQAHDVAPSIRDGYVIWHTRIEGSPNVLTVYEIDTGYTSTIEDPDGGHVENPRFVLVYDTSFENGDIITKEYDPKTGEVRPVGSLPAPVLPDIPSSDATGETRALINSKSSLKEETIQNNDGRTVSSSTVPSTGVQASSTNPTQSVDDAIPVVDVAASSTQVLPLDEFDLIVDPLPDVATNTASSSDAS